MSRYQPMRDRSPPRFAERRPSTTFAPPSASSAYRGANDPNQIPVDRAPPRGPKADNFRAGYQYGPPSRGRGGFTGRAEPWDRDRERDGRDLRTVASTYRREDDRPEWLRRDREFSQADRGSIGPRDSRQYRDRSASPGRARRDSKESLYTRYARSAEGSSHAPPSRGGAPRGRGREYERGRGRSSFAGERERDLFDSRSRSREGWRDRERERERDIDWHERGDRREVDRSRERDIRPREYDSWQRADRPPSRQESDHAGQATITPTTANSAGFSDASRAPGERPPFAYSDNARRPSIVLRPANLPRDSRRDGNGPDYGDIKAEGPSRDPAPPRLYSPSPAVQPPGSAALDYGPPPISVSSEKPSKAPLPKGDASTTNQASFQPPTGPKAERAAGGQLSLPPSVKAGGLDVWPKSDVRSRPVQPGPSSTQATASADNSKAPEAPADVSLPGILSPFDPSLPPNVPLGPRSGSTSLAKPRPGTKDTVVLSTAPVAPKSASRPVAAEQRAPNIPTGPRLWAPDNKPQAASRPSIMNPMKKSYYPDHRDRASFSSGSQRPDLNIRAPPTQPRMFQPSIMNRPAETMRVDDGKRFQAPGGGGGALKGTERYLDEQETGDDIDISMNASSDDDEVEDDDILDEMDFQKSEDDHKRAIKVLELRKPPVVLKDQAIVALLLRIQMLGMIADNAIPDSLQQKLSFIEEQLQNEPCQTGLPSPKHGSDEEPQTTAKTLTIGRPLKQSPVYPIPTPPVEDLPYLTKLDQFQSLTFADSENEVEQESMIMFLQQEFEQKAWEWRDEIDLLRNNYRENYFSWRQSVTDLDRTRDLKSSTPAPASPAPSAAPSVTPLLQERTRGAKNATEFDLEAVLRMSEQSAREDEEKRERLKSSKSKPNYETEAEIPAMLQPSEAELIRFKDTNGLVPLEYAVDLFALIPPVDDFTEEEQKIFVSSYIQNPKKFGKIAERLPGRTYRQCIMHYYLTKDEANYKESFRRAPSKRGRRKLGSTQSRASALLTDSMYQDDSETLPMTDSGRPRRAAAPTFGDAGADSETMTAGQSSRRTVVASKDVNGEQVVKSTRGRKAGTGTKTRRTKVQIEEDRRLAQMQLPNGSEGSPQKGRLTNRFDKLGPAPRGSTLNAKFEAGPPMELARGLDGELTALQPHHPDYGMVQPTMNPTSSSGPEIGSYWSVPEKQKFPELIAYFGRDFAAIADFMKTKSVVMIKNFYQRALGSGEKYLEDSAVVAETKRARGEPLGDPPTPVPPTKRKYEAPPLTAPRSIASAIDGSVSGPEPHIPKASSSLIEEVDPNYVQRGARGDLIAKPREVHNPPALLPQQCTEDPISPDRSSLQQHRQMPPGGFLRDERGEPRQSHGQFSLPEQHLHHHPTPRSIDLTRDEPPVQRSSLMLQQQQQQQQQSGLSRDMHGQHQQPSTLQYLQGEATPQQHLQNLLGHARSNSGMSSATSMPSTFDRTPEINYRRQENQHRGLPIGSAAAYSPVMAQQQGLPAQRVDLTRPGSVPAGAPVEPPKPAPAKKSNISSILNNDPPEPKHPEKRLSLETSRPPSTSSPPVSLARQQALFNQARQRIPADEMREIRQLYDAQPHSHQQSQYSSGQVEHRSPAPAQNGDLWLHRFDPRHPSTGPEHQSPAPSQPGQSHYSVAPPPTTSSGSVPGMQRFQHPETTNRTDPGRMGGVDPSLRRSLLGQLNLPTIVPSPPPQQQLQQQIQPHPGIASPYRSASNSSQHGRVSSIGYGLLQQPQQQPQPQPQPHTHSHSSNSTPVSSLHSQQQQHRSHASIGYEARLNLGPQPQLDHQTDRERQERIQQQVLREQAINVRAREQHEREMIEAQQQEREQRSRFSMMLDQDRDRGTLRQLERESAAQARQMAEQLGAEDSRYAAPVRQRPDQYQNQFMGIPVRRSTGGLVDREREIPRTFTPPHGHGGAGAGLGLAFGGGFGRERERDRDVPGQNPPDTQRAQQQQQGHFRSLSQNQNQNQSQREEEKKKR